MSGPRRRKTEPAMTAPAAQAQEFRRVLRRLAEGEARLVRNREDGLSLLVRRNRHAKPVLSISRQLGQALIAEGLIEALPRADEAFAITAEGLAFLRRAAGGTAPFAAQHRLAGKRYIGEDNGQGRVHPVNLAESPLTWLASRKGPDGAPLLSSCHVEAGERLREDYTRAGLMARVTVDWERPMAGGARGSDQGLTLGEAALAARLRVRAALTQVGTEFEDVLITVCCHLRGLEEVERGLGWPARSGKIVLKIALDRLARHYGIVRGQTKSPLRAWQP